MSSASQSLMGLAHKVIQAIIDVDASFEQFASRQGRDFPVPYVLMAMVFGPAQFWPHVLMSAGEWIDSHHERAHVLVVSERHSRISDATHFHPALRFQSLPLHELIARVMKPLQQRIFFFSFPP